MQSIFLQTPPQGWSPYTISIGHNSHTHSISLANFSKTLISGRAFRI